MESINETPLRRHVWHICTYEESKPSISKDPITTDGLTEAALTIVMWHHI